LPIHLKTIYLVRHGETDYNLANTVQGKGINAPLNQTGKRQAALLFRHYSGEPIDFVFTSTLHRTQQTVSGFVHRGLPWQPMHHLDEIGWGDLEGKPSDDVRPHLHALINRWKEGHLQDKVAGGESPLELQQRHQRFIAHYRSVPHRNILVCSHGRAMRILLSTMLNTPLEQMDQYAHSNTCVYKLTDNGKRIDVVFQNNVEHLNAVAV
jgi:phosphoserine phosphatase